MPSATSRQWPSALGLPRLEQRGRDPEDQQRRDEKLAAFSQ